ncbi:hypothetical protein GGX14DRAFT_398265 [Mycena pura]|uniref:Bacteriophage T5 Orf172 DNA-binding domain-containing protein n=1 Tax=Mycena pura TaxID=153505 RepID=A0AAD6V731_9AGAR|nr:hypothetical protein GGX14DRAFT_398265 [Mycena pura]
MASSLPPPDDVLLSPAAAIPLLRSLNDERLQALVDVSTFLGTSEGPIAGKSVTAILADTSVQISLDKTRYLSYNNKQLEFAVTVTPRSTWAFNNGPDGNYAHNSWKTGDAPKGVSVESNQGSYQVWTKTTRSATDLLLFWKTQLWPGNFLGSPRQVEMAMSGQPATQAAFDIAKSVHAAIDARFRTQRVRAESVRILVHAHPPFWPPDARRRGALYVLEVVLPDKRTVFKIGHTNRPGKRITELAKCSQRRWGVFWLVWDRRRLETIAHEFFRSAWLGLILCARCKKTHEEYFHPGLCGGRDGVIEGVETLLRALFWSSPALCLVFRITSRLFELGIVDRRVISSRRGVTQLPKSVFDVFAIVDAFERFIPALLHLSFSTRFGRRAWSSSSSLACRLGGSEARYSSYTKSTLDWWVMMTHRYKNRARDLLDTATKSVWMHVF